MHRGIKSVILLVIFSMCLSVLTPIKASALWNPPTTPTCNAVYLVNADTGTVIYQKNQLEKIYPASITKLMTAILVYEKYKDKLDTVITVQNSDLTPLSGTFGSLVPLKNGEQLSVEQLLNCLLIKSGDDSANVLARATAGSIDDFVDEMNAKAKVLGLRNTHYTNPHGLHNPDHYTTAYDVYLLEKYAMSIDELAKIVATSSYALKATNKSAVRNFTNTDYLINTSYKTYYYKYVKGVKTGTTTPAGACLASYAEKDGVTYFCVAMGGKKTGGTNTAFTETKALYQWVFGNFEITPIVKTTDTVTQVPLELAVQKTKMTLVPEKQLNSLVPSTYKSTDLKTTIHVPTSVKAPIKKGEKIGTEDIFIMNSQTKKLQKLGTVNLVANDDAVLSKPLYIMSMVTKFFNSIWFKVVAVLLILLLVLYVSLSVYWNSRKKNVNKRRGKKQNYRR